MRLHSLTLILALAAAPAAAATKPSPAQQKITWARAAIEKNPRSAKSHTDLAWALARRARETSDAAYYAEAERTVDTALALDPGNFEALKIRAWLLLGRHEFAAALELARTLNRRSPDDLLVYGFLADAHIELGNYSEAESAAQWMLDLRPGNIPGLTRAAYLRELFGDFEGAIELMLQAYHQTSFQATEDRAWLLTQMAHLQLQTGKLESAEQLLQQALGLFPAYHYSLGQMARLRSLQGRHEAAVDFYRQRYLAAPHPENLFDLAESLSRAGRPAETRRTYAEFEQKARPEMNSWDNANRELIAYYLGAGKNPVEALRIAESEVKRRRDVHTLDAYSWALFQNGRFALARSTMDSILAVGVRDSKILYHAGVIAFRSHDRASAARHFRASLAANPSSEVATAARRALARRG